MKRAAAPGFALADAMKRVRLTQRPPRPKRARSASPDALRTTRHQSARRRIALVGASSEAADESLGFIAPPHECAAACAQRAEAFARVGPEVDGRRALSLLRAEMAERYRVEQLLRNGLRLTFAENVRLRRDNAELLERIAADKAVTHRQSRRLNEAEGALAAKSACVQWVI